MSKLRRDDDVIVIAGKDKGRQGKVLKILSNDKLIVGGVNIAKKHVKPNPQKGVQGGIVEKEAALAISNVAIYNTKTQKADRLGYKVLEDGKKVRIYKSTGEQVGA